MGKTKKPVSQNAPTGSGNMGYYGSSGPSSFSDAIDPANVIARKIDREQLEVLLGTVGSSRNTFDGDVSTIQSAAALIDNTSPVVSNMIDHITVMLTDSTYDDDFDSVIRSICKALR